MEAWRATITKILPVTLCVCLIIKVAISLLEDGGLRYGLCATVSERETPP